MIPDDVLEALGLEPEAPSVSFLEKLFERFNARVPFETASKILRNAEVPDPAEKPRVPDVFWSEFIDRGAGGTCYPRVAAFDALLRTLGFATRKALGRVEKDFDHAALFVAAGGKQWLADVGFPLPALMPADGGEVEGGTAGVAATPSDRGLSIRFSAGVPIGPRRLEIFRAPVADEEYFRHWRGSFRPDSKFLRDISIHRHEPLRKVVFARGEVRVDDLHSRLRVPLTGDRPHRLAEIFDIEEDLLRGAFGLAGDPAPEATDATVTAYLSVPADPDRAWAAIATPDGYRRLMSGVADVEGEGWRFRLSPPGRADAGFEEEIVPDAARRALDVSRRYHDGRNVALSFRVDLRDDETWLVREAVLAGPREDLLVNDSARGRMAGTLAADLLGWARLLDETDRNGR